MGPVFSMKYCIRITKGIIVGCMVISFCVFLTSVVAVKNSVQSINWPTVKATIRVIEYRQGPGGRSPTMYLYVEYEYRFHGNVFISHDVGFMGFVPAKFKSRIKHYNVGQNVFAYVNPRNPSYAVLCRELYFAVYIAMALSFAIIVFLTWFLISLKNPIVESKVILLIKRLRKS